MISQSRVLIARLPRFAVAAIDLARVIQIVWILFNQMTVNGDETQGGGGGNLRIFVTGVCG